MFLSHPPPPWQELAIRHKVLFGDLDNAVNQRSGTISETFIKHKSQFIIYGLYCSNLLSAQDHIDEVCQDPKIKRKIEVGFVPSKYVSWHNKMWSNTNNKRCTSCLLLKKLRFLHFLTGDFNNKLSSDTKSIKIEVILLKVQLLQSVYLFLLYFTHYFVHYLRINLESQRYLMSILERYEIFALSKK